MGLHFAVTGCVRLLGLELHEAGLADPPHTIDDEIGDAGEYEDPDTPDQDPAP